MKGHYSFNINEQILVKLTDKGFQLLADQHNEETDKEAHSIYELVFHPDGKLTEDWAGQKEVECVAEVETVAATPRPRTGHIPAPTPSASSCGSMQSGRC